VRRTARILGFCGGVLGVGFGYLATYMGGPAAGLGAKGRGWLLILSLLAMLLAMVAGWVSATAGGRSRASVVVLFAAAVLGFVCLAAYWIAPGVLLFASASLFLAGRGKVDSSIAL
jgi:hypothetical protein